jgi:putative drug exporter of the RND superfamily
MRRLAAFAYDRRRLVAAAWIAAIVLAGALASGVGSGYLNNFNLPGTGSQRALDLLRHRFPQQSGDSSRVVFHVADGTLRDGARRAQVQRVVDRVAKQPSVASTISPYASRGAAISRDGRTAYATILFDKQAVDLDKKDAQRVVDTAKSSAATGLQVELGGQAIEISQRASTSAGELIGVLVAIVVLVLVLGSLAAMTMPLVAAFAAIAAAMGLVYAATGAFEVADFAPTLAVMIALGVGIDYGLLVINRFRGERAAGSDVREATLTAMDTAGRSVLFAGSTVVIALLGMLLLGISFLNGPALASATAVALTMVSSLTLLPALLGFFGRRVKPAAGTVAPRGWARWSRWIERRPHAFAAAALVVLVVVALPLTGMRLGSGDAGNDGPTKTTRQAYDLLSSGFGPGFNGPLLVVAEVSGSGARAELTSLERTLRTTDGVAAVSAPTLNTRADTATLTVTPTSSPQDAATKDLLARLRNDVVPRFAQSGALRVSIGGSTASTVDFGDALASKLPVFIGVVIGLSVAAPAGRLPLSAHPDQGGVAESAEHWRVAGRDHARLPGRASRLPVRRAHDRADRALPARDAVRDHLRAVDGL